jgi:hypothetical protein
VLIGDYILVYSGMTAIEQSDVGLLFAAPVPSRLMMVIENPVMAWHEPDPGPPPEYTPIPHPVSTEVRLVMSDQYGNPAIRPGGASYLFTLEFHAWVAGNGVIGHRSAGGMTLDPTTGPVTEEDQLGVVLTTSVQTRTERRISGRDAWLHGYVDYNGSATTPGGVRLLDVDGNLMLYGG